MAQIKLLFHIKDKEVMAQFAALFALFLKADDTVSLTGDLGAGKTYFVARLLESLAFKDEVQSPTFTLLREYFASENKDIPLVYHFDAYRLETTANFQAAALDAYFKQALCLVEWGNLIADILPQDTLQLDFSYNNLLNTYDLADKAVDKDLLVNNPFLTEGASTFDLSREELSSEQRIVTLTVPATLQEERQGAFQALAAFSEQLKAVD